VSTVKVPRTELRRSAAICDRYSEELIVSSFLTLLLMTHDATDDGSCDANDAVSQWPNASVEGLACKVERMSSPILKVFDIQKKNDSSYCLPEMHNTQT
jgi:hypothetical protein